MNYKEFIKEYMKENRITYADLASAMGVTRQSIWNTLNKKEGNLTLTTLQKICDALGLDISMIL